MNTDMPVYYRCNMKTWEHILVYIIASVLSTVVAWLFYHITPLAIILGFAAGIPLERMYRTSTIRKRQKKLRMQFKDFLASMTVAVRAGNVETKAVEAALADLKLSYSENSDIVREVSNILLQYHNGGIAMKTLFEDLAVRSDLDDIRSFATIYSVIEGKSDRFGDILVQTEEIIRDKVEIEQEIETTITSAKSETYVMLVMPVLIVAMLGAIGGEIMNSLFEPPLGTLSATVALIIFGISFAISMKVTDINV
ncbi:MAG: type II secretion system F family protein [Lachnospiraceae bacterium]|nr:type II secretion system F family protein [Lachnospiraceae bacterium]